MNTCLHVFLAVAPARGKGNKKPFEWRVENAPVFSLCCFMLQAFYLSLFTDRLVFPAHTILIHTQASIRSNFVLTQVKWNKCANVKSMGELRTDRRKWFQKTEGCHTWRWSLWLVFIETGSVCDQKRADERETRVKKCFNANSQAPDCTLLCFRYKPVCSPECERVKSSS